MMNRKELSVIVVNIAENQIYNELKNESPISASFEE